MSLAAAAWPGGRVNTLLLHRLAQPLVFALCLLPFLWLVLQAATNGLGANPQEALIRSTGDWALRFVCITLAVTPLRVVAGLPAVARWRRMLGLFAFFYAGVHLLSYAVFDMGLDAAMNDLPRPAMYEAFHQIVAVCENPGPGTLYDVVGPVCESGDWLGRQRLLHVAPGELLAVLSAGAYCMSMASNYNTRGRAAEILVDGSQAHLIRERENASDQMRGERLV